MDRLKSALEQLDASIDHLAGAVAKRDKHIDRLVEDRAAKRVRQASETADRALKQAKSREDQALSREKKQKDITGMVASQLDRAIHRLEKIVGSV